MTLDLPIFDRNQGQIAIGETTRQQLFDEYIARVAEARSQVGEILAGACRRADPDPRCGCLAARLAAILRRRWTRRCGPATRTRDAGRDARAALAARQIERAQLQQQILELGVALEIATGRPLLDRAL